MASVVSGWSAQCDRPRDLRGGDGRTRVQVNLDSGITIALRQPAINVVGGHRDISAYGHRPCPR